MRIALITPPSPFLLDERVFPALGILRVAAVLEAAGHQVDHLDLCGVTNSEQAVRDYQGATVFGITATTPQIPAAVRIGAVLRERGSVKTILGGPHPTLVHAAAKRGNERAQKSLNHLLDKFDVVVTGDGEKAIFTALHSRGLVDADDPKGILWNTSMDFAQSPFPARHLVDMESYHYGIDGAKATSMIAQLGCLTGDTPIAIQYGRTLPIKDLKVGDHVLCFDESTGRLDLAPVAQTYSRYAADIWEIKWESGLKVQITGEHPIFAKNGWETAATIQPGTISACLPGVRKAFRGSFQKSKRGVVLENVSVSVAEKESECQMVSSGTTSTQSKSGSDDPMGEVSVLHGQTQQLRTTHAGHSGENCGIKAWGEKPDEEAGGSAESIRHDESEMGRVFQEASHGKLEERQDQTLSRETRHFSESDGSEFKRYLANGSSSIPMVRRRSILDWPMLIGSASKSRLYPSPIAQSDPDARGVLASGRGGDSGEGLLEPGLATVDCVEQGITDQVSPGIDRKTPLLWSRIVSKKFIGEGIVYNLTVHPGHTYFANQMLVHNCPFHCFFCGGRNSPMLRQIRVRPADSVVEEMMHLHERYGMTGIMHFQDELNVSHKGLVDLMVKIKETGIPWQQRGFVKAELFNDEQAEAMYAAGFRWLLCGFESAHPRILKNIAKNATREDNTRMLQTAHKHGIKVKALMSVGHPGESEETVLATRDWLLEEKPDDFDVTIITVYPGTPYFDESVCIGEPVYRFETNGDVLYSENTDFHLDMQYYKGAPGEYKSYVWTDSISRERLCELRDEIEAEVRSKLGIPYASGAAAINFEHGMGMSLPSTILRRTA